jgi:arabinogalactan oligomer/maltooligosaccharide transport system substrate-binding protein
MDVSNGWYIVSFFLGGGGSLSIGADGKQVCDFNNYPGVGESMKNITASNAFLTGDDTVIVGGMGDTIAAAVSGTWNATAIQEKLGDNYAATKLPTFDVDGTPTQMSSFAGFKLIGVNSLSAFPAEAMDLADWLSNEENQLKRFYARQIGPSNLNAAANPDVLANVALSALAEQGEFAKSQNDVLGNFWTPAEAFGQAMENKDYSKSVQELLDDMVAQIQA